MSDILESVKQFYNEAGEYFSKTRQKSYNEKGDYTWLEVRPYLKKLKKGMKILDLGCGNGRLVSGLPKGIEYQGVDFSKTLIKEAIKLFKGREFVVADITKEDTWKELSKYDAIFSIATLHHLPRREQQLFVLKQSHSHLKKDCFVYISVWNMFQPRFFNMHLKSLELKAFNKRWLNVPFQNKWERFCYLFDKRYLKKLMKEAGFQVNKIAYVDRDGKETNALRGRNLIAVGCRK